MGAIRLDPFSLGRETGRPKTITILHTNDIPAHLTSWQGWAEDLQSRQVGGRDRLASAVDRVRRSDTLYRPITYLSAKRLLRFDRQGEFLAHSSANNWSTDLIFSAWV